MTALRASRACNSIWQSALREGCGRALFRSRVRLQTGINKGKIYSLAPFRDPDGLLPHSDISKRRPLVSTSASSDMLVPRHFHSSVRKESFDTSPMTKTPLDTTSQRQETEPSPANESWKLLVGMCALSVVISYADRSNISTAILPMAAAYGWDKAFQGVVLSSFFLGYALTQMLGGQLADRLGGKLVLTAGITLWSIFTGAIPAAAAAGTVPLLATRVMLGVGEGVAFPAIHSLIARNVPYANQSTAVGIVTAASYAGTALAFGISPIIISSMGWESVFYIFAGFAVLWLPFWLPIQVKPQRDQIGAAAPSTSGNGSSSSSSSSIAVKAGPPLIDRGFWALLKRKEVWAICVAQYCGSWGMYGLLNWLPTFFTEYYNVEISDLASYTLVPYIVQGGLGAVSGFVADSMISSGWSVRQVRIGLQVIGMIGPAACLLLAVSPAVGASATLASQLITIGLGFSALTLGGVSTSHLDIAPKHAGVIFGAGNTAATLAGFLSVPVTGYLLQTFDSWPLVFGITAAHYFVGAIFWALWVGDKPLPEDSMLVEEKPVVKELQA